MKIKVFSAFLLLFVATHVISQDIELDSNAQVERSKFEAEVHFSGWTITPISTLFKDRLDEYYTEEVLAAFENAIAGTGIDFDPSELGFRGDFDYSSSGSIYGLALRYIPRNSKFTIGLSIDKTNVTVRGATTIIESALLTSTGVGEVNLKPLMFGIQTQYYFTKGKRVNPYLSFGLGAGYIDKNNIAKNKVSIITENQVILIGPVNTLQEYTLQESEDRGSQPVPSIFPLAQLSFGLQLNVSEPIAFMTEVGIFNGLHGRIGLAVRI